MNFKRKMKEKLLKNTLGIFCISKSYFMTKQLCLFAWWKSDAMCANTMNGFHNAQGHVQSFTLRMLCNSAWPKEKKATSREREHRTCNRANMFHRQGFILWHKQQPLVMFYIKKKYFASINRCCESGLSSF